jgi:hypothetical protein
MPKGTRSRAGLPMGRSGGTLFGSLGQPLHAVWSKIDCSRPAFSPLSLLTPDDPFHAFHKTAEGSTFVSPGQSRPEKGSPDQGFTYLPFQGAVARDFLLS